MYPHINSIATAVEGGCLQLSDSSPGSLFKTLFIYLCVCVGRGGMEKERERERESTCAREQQLGASSLFTFHLADTGLFSFLMMLAQFKPPGDFPVSSSHLTVGVPDVNACCHVQLFNGGSSDRTLVSRLAGHAYLSTRLCHHPSLCISFQRWH